MRPHHVAVLVAVLKRRIIGEVAHSLSAYENPTHTDYGSFSRQYRQHDIPLKALTHPAAWRILGISKASLLLDLKPLRSPL